MPPRESIPLRDEEIEELYRDFDHDQDGKISFQELEKVLKDVYDELAPDPQRHHLTHSERSQNNGNTDSSKKHVHGEKASPQDTHHDSDLHDFLCKLMPGCGDTMSKEEFFKQVRSWNVPSQDQTGSEHDNNDAKDYDRKLSRRRRLLAWWSVKGPEVAFIVFVGALILAFSLWQGLIYATSGEARAALGGGVVAAKFSAGAVYPTFFFLILSMSRWFATFCRKSYLVSRFINWDLSQSFHIWMSCLALVFSLTHVIGHLSGTFVYGSSSGRQENLQRYLGSGYVRRSYSDYIASRPGWSGLTAIISFLIIALTSIPTFRKKHYEIFQLAHLLMYLMFAMLAIHGTAKLLQAPMLGYWLAFPVICVLLERSRRLYLTLFGHNHARLEALDDGTVVITAEKPEGQKWRARAGQYVLLQVPQVSRFQWHPFTISTCIGNRLQIHIKADGNWQINYTNLPARPRKTARRTSLPSKLAWMDLSELLRSAFILLTSLSSLVQACKLTSQFSASTRNDSLLNMFVSSGVTPFSACLTDLEENFNAQGDPWKLTRTRSFGPQRHRTISRAASPSVTRTGTESDATAADTPPAFSNDTNIAASKPLQIQRRDNPGSFGVRRCDFHWSVREKNDLLWFSSLLNRAAELAQRGQNLTLNIHAHITAKRKKLSTHVFRYLLDDYRTEEFPYSALTGLRIKSEFGRPDYEAILEEFYEDMMLQGWHGRVGIFHCGPPIIGEMLADLCSQITARASTEGTGMRFMFHNEVFG